MKKLILMSLLMAFTGVVLTSCDPEDDTPSVVTITFEANGGEGTMGPQAFTEGVPANLNANTFSRTDFTFSGWAATATGALEYTDGASYTATEDATLFAVWNEISSFEMEMVYVEGGTFQMGSNDSEAGSNEQPVHSVTLDSYYIGKYEVTQAEWQAVMGTNPSCFQGDNLPVERVNWYEVVEFCNALSEQNGFEKCYTITGANVTVNWDAKGYRLPTEAEWEFAARGGNQSVGYKYSGSNTIDDVAWYSDNSGSQTYAVGQKQANELGIYDMSGNVWEWCWDWYDNDYYSNSQQSNPTGPETGSVRVLRGGSWFYYAQHCRLAFRYYISPSYRNDYYGVRLALVQ